MVHKVDGNSYYDYTKPKNVDIPNTGEKFSLGYQKDGLPSDLKDKKEKEVSDQEKQQATERGGVRVELSGQGVEKQKQARNQEMLNGSGVMSMLETIRTFLTTTVETIKDIFSKIWNDPQPEENLGEALETSDAISVTEISESFDGVEDTEILEPFDNMEGPESFGAVNSTEIMETPKSSGTMGESVPAHIDEEKQDREIRQYLQNGDMNQVIRLLTDNGRKTIARNSTLLTCYDKNGKIIKLDASVQSRALYGDRNARKL